MSTLENSQPPRICTLEHISLPNPQFAVDQAIRGCSSLDTRASPLQGSMTWCYGEEPLRGLFKIHKVNTFTVIRNLCGQGDLSYKKQLFQVQAGNGCNLKVQISATLSGAGLPLNTSILPWWNFAGNARLLLLFRVMGRQVLLVIGDCDYLRQTIAAKFTIITKIHGDNFRKNTLMTCPGAKTAWKTQFGTTPIVSLEKEVALQQVTGYSSVKYKEFGFDVNPNVSEVSADLNDKHQATENNLERGEKKRVIYYKVFCAYSEIGTPTPISSTQTNKGTNKSYVSQQREAPPGCGLAALGSRLAKASTPPKHMATIPPPGPHEDQVLWQLCWKCHAKSHQGPVHGEQQPTVDNLTSPLYLYELQKEGGWFVSNEQKQLSSNRLDLQTVVTSEPSKAFHISSSCREDSCKRSYHFDTSEVDNANCTLSWAVFQGPPSMLWL
ncbi:hypothetical protein Anapl_10719 [Anas platyrhynchos]|uniref:Uncharacterized protein n=1 Tax=Anas platyrhynchos TaxID=8839 RepID=R0K0R5_ANAPL|nr:hypothetical protein Anapl_10719 [Anas platyrhynchos]